MIVANCPIRDSNFNLRYMHFARNCITDNADHAL